VAEKEIQNATVLGILPAREDWLSLSAAFADSGWMLVFTGTLRRLWQFCGASLSVWCYVTSVFPGAIRGEICCTKMREMEDPPPLIVADCLADDPLWAEVLGLGAENRLAKPFHPGEVLRAVTTACRRQENQRGPVRKRIQPETGSRDSKEAARAIAAAR
jgi:hypothetical protein